METSTTKEKILNTFREMTQEHGIKKITMEMLAAECGISKKTIYVHFKNKKELVQCLVNNFAKWGMDKIKAIQESDKGPLEQFDSIHELSIKIFSQIPTLMIHDIKKYYPEINDLIENGRASLDLYFIEKYKEGISKGIFKDIDPAFIHAFFRGAGDRVFDTDFILKNNFTLEDSFKWFDTLYKTGLMIIKNR